MNRICPPPFDRLVKCAEEGNIIELEELIKNNKTLLTFVDVEHNFKTITEICMDNCYIDAIEKLVKLGAIKQCKENEISILHLAAENPNSAILEIITSSESCDINELRKNETALFTAIRAINKDSENMFIDNVNILLKHCINVNHKNINNQTAIAIAAYKNYKSIVNAILDNYSTNQVDLDGSISGKTAKEWIQLNELYDLNQIINTNSSPPDPKLKLFELINASSEEEFIDFYDTHKFTDANMDDGECTLLQRACQKGRFNIVKFLLEVNADPTRTIKLERPIYIAAKLSYFEIVQLLKKSIDIDTLCHLIINYYSPFKKNVRQDLLKEILKMRDISKNIVNKCNYTNNTPLYLSLLYASDEISLQLLNLNATLVYKNDFNKMPIDHIEAQLLEKHLDSCIKKTEDSEWDQNLCVEMNFQTLISPNNEFIVETHSSSCLPLTNKDVKHEIEKFVPEMEVFVKISQKPELKPLLKHPLIATFLLRKWTKLCWIYYTNLTLYFAFIFCLGCHITLTYTNFKIEFEFTFFLFALILLYILLVLRELFQGIHAGIKYFCELENWIELILIIITTIILFTPQESPHIRKPTAAIAIIVAAFELILMLGHDPRFSTNVVMFKTVLKNFFKMLLWYSVLIGSFAWSFNILFDNKGSAKSISNKKEENNKTNCGDDDENFTDVGSSLFKTFVMLTGEFDAGSIDFEKFPFAGRLIFILFVFMITIILLNLLTGLAVSDTHQIKNDAELVVLKSRVNYLFYIENLLSTKSKKTKLVNYFSHLFCCCRQYTMSYQSAQRTKSNSNKIEIKPYLSGEIVTKKSNCTKFNIVGDTIASRVLCIIKKQFISNKTTVLHLKKSEDDELLSRNIANIVLQLLKNKSSEAVILKLAD